MLVLSYAHSITKIFITSPMQNFYHYRCEYCGYRVITKSTLLCHSLDTISVD